MRFKIYLPVLVGFLLSASAGCQRDDICPASTQTTPMLRISFFDAEEPDIPKPPVNLRVKASDYDSIFLNRVNVAEISIPLRPDATVTDYDFIINAQDLNQEPGENTNLDRIRFSYTPNEEYINRACSFRVTYLGLNANIEEDSNRWINSILVQEENIENETNPHIYIYH